MDRLELVVPSARYAGQVMEYRAEMLGHGDSLDGCGGLEEVADFAAWMDFETRLRGKYGAEYVPSWLYLAVRIADGRLVGMIDFRLELSEPLRKFGGNIGYSVRPSERRKGYAAEMLGLLLPKCRAAGKERVLVTCGGENEGSRRTILRNGGILEDEVPNTAGLGRYSTVQRYWISL